MAPQKRGTTEAPKSGFLAQIRHKRLRLVTSSDEDESSHQSSEDRTKPNEHVAAILAGIDTCRRNGVFCDVILLAENEEFPAHKLVLGCFTDYFKAMFTSGMAEQEKARVPLKEVRADQLRAILDYMYTGTISITYSNVESILSAANYLQVEKVKDRCCLFLKERLDVTNCLSINRIAKDCFCPDLAKEATSCAYSSFDQVMRHKEFLELPADKLREFLSSGDINVKKEEHLFEGVISWLNHRPEERTQGFEEILQHIRLPLMNPYYLRRKVGTTPVVQQNEKCQKLLATARYLQECPDLGREGSFVLTTPRKNSLMVPAAILIGGWNGDCFVQHTDCFVPSRDKWLSLAKLSGDVNLHGASAIDQNSLLVAGGRQRYTSTSAASLFNPALNSWCKAAPMTLKREHVSLAAVDGYVYAVGAPSGELKVCVERYDAVVNQWDPVKKMKIELLQSPVAASQGGRLLVSGVFKEGDDVKGCIQSYDPYTDSWKVLSTSLPSLYHLSSCVYNNKLYLVGGWDKVKNESSRSVICFDPETTSWSVCEPMEEGRASPGVAVIEGKMFVFGGSKNVSETPSTADTLGTMEVYNLRNNGWLRKEKMERKRCWHGCVVLNIPTRMLESKEAKQ